MVNNKKKSYFHKIMTEFSKILQLCEGFYVITNENLNFFLEKISKNIIIIKQKWSKSENFWGKQ